jgi:hypothetical protein
MWSELQVWTVGRVRLKCDGTRWRTGGEVKGKLANGVGSQYSHTTSERGVSSITNADAHTSAARSRLNWGPRRFKWTSPFRRKTTSGFCACAITFQTQSIKYVCTYTALNENQNYCSRTLSAIWYSVHITVYQKLVALPLGRNRLTNFVRSKSVSEWLKSKFSFWNFIIIT